MKNLETSNIRKTSRVWFMPAITMLISQTYNSAKQISSAHVLVIIAVIKS